MELFVDDVGKIYVSGFKFKNLRIYFKKFEESFIGVQPIVTVTEIRDINVLIMGFVKFPGCIPYQEMQTYYHL